MSTVLVEAADLAARFGLLAVCVSVLALAIAGGAGLFDRR